MNYTLKGSILLENGKIIMDSETVDVINHYYGKTFVNASFLTENEINERVEGFIEKNNPFIRFKSVGIYDVDDNPRTSFYSDEDIIIKIGYL